MSTTPIETNKTPLSGTTFLDNLADTDWLEQQRHKSDPIADDTITKIIEGGQLEKVNLVFDLVMKNKEIPENEMPEALRDYFEQTAELPSWADTSLIQKGEEFFQTNGSQICMMLLCKSLPTMYACKRGAQVLGMSGRFQGGDHEDMKTYTRRLMETIQFVINVTSPKGLGASGRGIRTTQKVRLIHAAIRYYLTQRHSWNTEKLGIPINQQDLATTLMSFSIWPIEGMAQIGVDATEEEQEAFLHLWKVVGHLLGINADLFPANFNEGKAWADTIVAREKGSSEAGEKLTAGCISFFQYIIPGTIFDFFPQHFIRFIIGDELANMVGVEQNKGLASALLEKGFQLIIGKLDDYKDQNEATRKLAMKFNIAFLQGMVLYFNDYKQASLYIPPSLKENWEKSIQQSEWSEVVNSPSFENWRISLQHRNI